MARPKSVVLTPEQVKESVKTNKARIREMQAQHKTLNGRLKEALKAQKAALRDRDTVTAAMVKDHTAANKATQKQIDDLAKQIAAADETVKTLTGEKAQETPVA